MNPWREFSIDHVIPKSLGGTIAIDTLVSAGRDGNQAKADRRPRHLVRSATTPPFGAAARWLSRRFRLLARALATRDLVTDAAIFGGNR